MTDVIETTRANYEAVKDLRYPSGLEPSPVWDKHLDKVLNPGIYDSASADDVIEYVTGNNVFTLTRTNNSREAYRIAHRFIGWLETYGTPLCEFDETVQETPYASATIPLQIEGRRESTTLAGRDAQRRPARQALAHVALELSLRVCLDPDRDTVPAPPGNAG